MKNFTKQLCILCVLLLTLCACQTPFAGLQATPTPTATPAPTPTPEPTPTPDPKLGTFLTQDVSPVMQKALQLVEDLDVAYNSYQVASINGAAEAATFLADQKNCVKGIDDTMQEMTPEERAAFEPYYNDILSRMDISVPDILAEFAALEQQTPPAEDVPAEGTVPEAPVSVQPDSSIPAAQ